MLKKRKPFEGVSARTVQSLVEVPVCVLLLTPLQRGSGKPLSSHLLAVSRGASATAAKKRCDGDTVSIGLLVVKRGRTSKERGRERRILLATKTNEPDGKGSCCTKCCVQRDRDRNTATKAKRTYLGICLLFNPRGGAGIAEI